MEQNNDELLHYGVPGMKWGVRKSVYKSMNRQERKETRKKYRQTPEGKIKKYTTIGTILGGPLGGIIAGSIANKKINSVPKQTIKKGEIAVKSHIEPKTDYKHINKKTYNKFYADDVEGVVKNMTKEQRDDVFNNVSKTADWPEIEDYIARKYNK